MSLEDIGYQNMTKEEIIRNLNEKEKRFRKKGNWNKVISIIREYKQLEFNFYYNICQLELEHNKFLTLEEKKTLSSLASLSMMMIIYKKYEEEFYKSNGQREDFFYQKAGEQIKIIENLDLITEQLEEYCKNNPQLNYEVLNN